MAGVIGADVEELRALSKTFMAAADRLQGVVTETNGRLAGTRWIGPDGDRHRQQWQSQSTTYLRTAADALRAAASALSRNADEQQQASAAGTGTAGGQGGLPNGVTSGLPHGLSIPGLRDPGFGFPNPFNTYRDFMDGSTIWPIQNGTAFGMSPLSGLTEMADWIAMLGDDRLSVQDKVGTGVGMLWDVGAGDMRQAGFETRDPALYLAGAAASQWADVVTEYNKADFSAVGQQTVKDYIAKDPGGAMKAAADAVVDYLPKMISNFSINPFGK